MIYRSTLLGISVFVLTVDSGLNLIPSTNAKIRTESSTRIVLVAFVFVLPYSNLIYFL